MRTITRGFSILLALAKFSREDTVSGDECVLQKAAIENSSGAKEIGAIRRAGNCWRLYTNK